MVVAKVVGCDIICSAGLDKFETFKNTMNKKSSVGPEGLARISDSNIELLLKTAPSEFQHSKCTILSYHALNKALLESGWSPKELQSSGFIFASTTSQIDHWENDLPSYREANIDMAKINSAVFNQSVGSPLVTLSDFFQIGGPKNVVVSSCSAGLQALSMAANWISQGIIDRCIVGGTEILSDLTCVGFNSLRLVEKNSCKPFSKNRSGINLGEGSGFIFLEKATPDSNSSWCEISGSAFNLDAYHPTSPHPQGLGSYKVLSKALRQAGLNPLDIDWIYTHGTGSAANDLSEANAIKSLFAGSPIPPITSTKSIHGHTLAASGIIESVLGLMALKEQQLIPTLNDGVEDPAIGLDIVQSPRSAQIRHFIKNSLGFGGVNASVLFSARNP